MKRFALKSLNSSCPAQWEGTDDQGREVYIRYRWGELSIATATGNETMDLLLIPEIVVSIGHEMDGCMTDADLVEHLKGLGIDATL